MYCGQCGKKVKEHMLFCPFCGTAIEIPEQDDKHASESSPQVTASAQPNASGKEELHAPAKDESNEKLPEQEPFEPLRFEFKTIKSETAQNRAALVEDLPEPMAQHTPPRRDVRSTPHARKRKAQTYIPVRDVDPDNLFMGDEFEAEMDFDEAFQDTRPGDTSAYEFEEREHGSFFHRHVRGIIALILLAMVLLALTLWAALPNGQRTLAKFNLAWKSTPYAELAGAIYETQPFLAAKYYERAFDRDLTNVQYAHNAMVLYYNSGEIDRASTMLKKCIELNPQDLELYLELLMLYPHPEERPREIRELIAQGYELTGNAALENAS